jgi:hypothetical protein
VVGLEGPTADARHRPSGRIVIDHHAAHAMQDRAFVTE